MTTEGEESPARGAPPDGIRADDAAQDPAAVRVTEFPAGSDSDAQKVVGPAGEPDLEVRWVGRGRASVTGPGAAGGHVDAILGKVEPTGRDGRARREVVVGGWRIVFDLEPEGRARLRALARRGREDAAHGGPLDVRAIIPGRVVGVSVTEGEAVEAGQQLLVIEAMKMQNELRSPRAGTVERIIVTTGQTVELGSLLLVLR